MTLTTLTEFEERSLKTGAQALFPCRYPSFFMRITAVPFVPDARFRLSVPRSPSFVLVACEINEIKVQVFKKNVQSTSRKKISAKIKSVQRAELRDTGSK